VVQRSAGEDGCERRIPNAACVQGEYKLLAYDGKTLARVIASGVLVEVKCDEETVL
jgi:hypothetical protein